MATDRPQNPRDRGLQALRACLDDRLSEQTEAFQQLGHDLRMDAQDREKLRTLRATVAIQSQIVQRQSRLIDNQAEEIRRLKAESDASSRKGDPDE